MMDTESKVVDTVTERFRFVCNSQLIICHDGVNGLCYEHSSAEGVAVVNLMEKLIERSALMSSVNQISTSLQDATPEPLLWNINASLHKHIRDAARTFDR